MVEVELVLVLVEVEVVKERKGKEGKSAAVRLQAALLNSERAMWCAETPIS